MRAFEHPNFTRLTFLPAYRKVCCNARSNYWQHQHRCQNLTNNQFWIVFTLMLIVSELVYFLYISSCHFVFFNLLHSFFGQLSALKLGLWCFGKQKWWFIRSLTFHPLSEVGALLVWYDLFLVIRSAMRQTQITIICMHCIYIYCNDYHVNEW